MGAHVLATACVIALAWWLAVSTVEWCILAIVIGLVGTAELLNTAIEVVVNELCPDRNRYAGLAKDISAGGVLWASMSAVVVGLVIFGPKLWVLIFNQT
jgi:diacylglycerol kinase (ATP)